MLNLWAQFSRTRKKNVNLCQDKGVLNVYTSKSVIQHLSAASSQLTTFPAPNFEHTNTYTAIKWWLLMPGISTCNHTQCLGCSCHTWYVPSSICGSLRLSQFLFSSTSASLSRLTLPSEGYCHISAGFNLSQSASARPQRGVPTGGSFGSRRHIRRKTQWQQDEIELQIWFGSRAGNFCGRFSISVCRLERGGLRLSDSSYLAQIWAVPTPMSILCH